MSEKFERAKRGAKEGSEEAKLGRFIRNAESLSEKGKWDEVILHAKPMMILETNQENKAEGHFFHGNAYNAKGNYNQAIVDFDQALVYRPGHAKTYLSRGIAHFNKGDRDQAFKDFDEAINCNPDFWDAYFLRGSSYTIKGDYDQAIQDFNKVIKYKPDYAEAYYLRGFAHGKKGDHDLAITDFNKAIDLKDFVEARYLRGFAYVSKHDHDYDQAITDFDKVLECSPDFAEARYLRGFAYVKKGTYDQAIEDLNQVIEHKPDFAEACYLRGYIYAEEGNHDSAITDFLSTVESDPKWKFTNALSYATHQINAISGDEVENRAKPFKIYFNLIFAIWEIKEKLFCKPKDYGEIAHYTPLDALKKLAVKSPFRLRNAADMDDTKEGAVLREILGGELVDTFYKDAKKKSSLSPAYTGSFVDESFGEDDFMWKSYGKAGARLIFKRDDSYFEKETSSLMGPMQHMGLEEMGWKELVMRQLPMRQLVMPQSAAKHLTEERLAAEKANPGFKMPLYKIVYKSDYEKELKNELQNLKKSLQEIKTFHDSQDNDNKESLAKLTREMLDDIRFLFKADCYKKENELRVIVMRYNEEDGTPSKLDVLGIKDDAERTPPSFYWEAPKNFRSKKVILGPGTKGVPRWKQWLKWHNPNLIVKKSKIKLEEDDTPDAPQNPPAKAP